MTRRKRGDDYITNWLEWQEHQYVKGYFINNWRMRAWGLNQLRPFLHSRWGWLLIAVAAAAWIPLIFWLDWNGGNIFLTIFVSLFSAAYGLAFLRKPPPGRTRGRRISKRIRGKKRRH